MTDEERRRAAQAILNIPLFNAVFDEMENAAITACINAAPTEHEKRADHALEARAIRRIRSRLASIAEQATESRKAPA